MTTSKEGVAVAAVMTVLAACGSESDEASDSVQPASVPSSSIYSRSDVMAYLGVDENGNVVTPSRHVCEIRTILTTAEDVRKSLEVGTMVSISRDGTTGVVVMAKDRERREHCALFIDLIMSTFPDGEPYLPPSEEPS